MTRYFLHRIVRSVFVLLAISFLSFLLFEAAPGDYFTEARLNSQISPHTLEALRLEYGLDRPMLVKYTAWLGSVVRGDWGVSIASNTPVAPLLRTRALNTLALTVPATCIAWAIAIPFGVWIAARPHTAGRRTVGGFVYLLIAVPDLLAVVVLMAIAARTNILPVGGMMSLDAAGAGAWVRFQDALAHLVLPATALAIAALPPLIAHTRAAMAEVLESSFIRAGRASGIPSRRLLYRHALPAAMNPLVSLFGLSVGTLLSSSLLVEAAMGWPGLGGLLLEAAFQRDYYLVIGAVMISAAFLIAGNLLADLLLFAADPRIRRS